MPSKIKEKSLVSIAIPAYKRTYLAEAIDSALSQDYQNIELIIVNDHSPYDLDSIVSQYHDSRIRYYKNKRNLGKRSIVLNWNRCLEYARGEFFVLLCDDDVLMPNFVTELLKLANKYPQCNVFHARKIEKDERDGSMTETPIWPEYENSNDFVKQYFDGSRKFTISEFLYRTTHIVNIKYKVFPSGYFSDDASLVLFTKEGGVVSSKTPLLVFRFSDEHIGSSGLYNIGKARAMRQYIRWARKDPLCKKYCEKKIQSDLKTSIGYFVQCKGWRKFLIVPYIPWTKENLRIVWIIFGKMLRHKAE